MFHGNTAWAEAAAATSTPLHRGGETTQLSGANIDDVGTGSEEDPYILVRACKRQRQTTGDVVQQQQQAQTVSRVVARSTGSVAGRRARGLLVVGKAANTSQQGMLAAERSRGNIPVERAVFYVDNVGMQHSAIELRTFVSKMGVRVLSCFEVQPRRRRFELNRPSRKAVRLCVADSDRELLLDADKLHNCL